MRGGKAGYQKSPDVLKQMVAQGCEWLNRTTTLPAYDGGGTGGSCGEISAGGDKSR